MGNKKIYAIKQLADIFKKPRSDKVSTSVSAPRVPNNVTAAPSLRVLDKDRSSHRVAAHPKHQYLTRQNMELPHQANSSINIPTHRANAIIDPTSGASMEYRHLIKSPKHKAPWNTSFSNKLGRLAQGVGDRVKGTDTIYFIDYTLIPNDRCGDITYVRILVDYCPHKTERNRTRLTVGGNLINYPGDVSTPTAETTTAKIVINSTISTPKAKYLVGDVNIFYLGAIMTCYEYLQLSITTIPQEIIDKYNLLPLVRNR